VFHLYKCVLAKSHSLANKEESMSKQEWQMRVRPHRIACLLPWSATEEETLTSIEFLSHLWGGRHCPLIPIKPESENELAKFWLSQSRPDIVCGIGIDHKSWAQICQECCQPYAYAQLDRRVISELYSQTPIGLITANYVFETIFRDNPGTETSNIGLIHITAPCKLAALIGVTFGIYDKEEIEWMKKALRAEVVVIPDDITVADYIGMCKTLSNKWSALDLASSGLNRHIRKGGIGILKTIIVGENNAAQFSLFWNLRMQMGAGSSREILLFPISEIEKQDSKEALVEWIAAGPGRCNYCEIISISTEVGYLRSMADWLKPRVKGFGIDFIDIYYGNVQIPLVVGYDAEISASVELDERVVTFAPPMPRFYELLPANRRWIVDLLKDKRTLRVPLEIYPVPSVSAKEVLNAPFPPLLKLGLDQVRIGTDSLSFACAKEDGNLRYFMPTEAEFLQEAFRSFGMDIVRDEKQVCYQAVLQVFKDLEEAGRAFSGLSLSICLP